MEYAARKTVRLCLQAHFTDVSITQWYHTATVGELALVEIPSRTCIVELLCRTAERVIWSVRGGRSMTMPLSAALCRLQLLSTDEAGTLHDEADTTPRGKTSRTIGART